MPQNKTATPIESTQHYPVLPSLASQPDVASELKNLRSMIYNLEGRLNSQTQPPPETLTPAQLEQVRKALAAGGTHPLNVQGLLGVLQQTQP